MKTWWDILESWKKILLSHTRRGISSNQDLTELEERKNPFPFFREEFNYFGRKEGGGGKIIKNMKWGWFYLRRAFLIHQAFWKGGCYA